jgi:CBS domain containing-hemolysin-like protein
MEIEIIIATLILLLLVFLATIDIAFSQLSDVSLRKLASDLDEKSNLLELLENRPRFRFGISATIQILLVIFAVLATVICFNFFAEQSKILVISLALSLFLAFVFRQFIPRLITWKNPENKLIILLPFVRPFYGIMSFLSDPLDFFTKPQTTENSLVPNKKDDENDSDDEDLQALIEVGEAEGIIEEDDRELIETMVEFGETRVGEIMTPRTEICGIENTATVKEARDLMLEEKYSRLPVFRENIEDIEGFIYVRDLLQVWADGKENSTIDSLVRDVYFVPETKLVDELLEEMQRTHAQLVIVIDEYGGVAGLVTLEDIVEEIVGEIEDEDTEQEEVIEIIEGEDGSYFDVLGSTEIGKIERIFDMEIEDDDFTTIAGLVIGELGYVPKKGEKLTWRGLKIEILKAEDKKIQLLRLKKSFDDD